MSTFTGQSTGSTAVDLSKLPFPAVIEVLSFETIVAACKSRLIELMPELEPVLAIPSEPLVLVIEIFAYRETLLRARVNDAARDVTLAYATGAMLDHLVALLGVKRLVIEAARPETNTPAVMESDDSLRRRALLAPEAYSVAGPAGAYVSHALGADGDVLDASATTPSPGVVLVTVLSRQNDGVPSAELLDKVFAVVAADDVRPLTDHVQIQAAQIVPFDIKAAVSTFAGPDSAVVMDEARRRLNDYLDRSYRLGRDVTRSGIIAALHTDGVQNVRLTAPAADVVISAIQAARCASIAVTHAGLDE
ncbi:MULTISPECIES: baseplate assembly protein [Brevundimonas]|uniref:baseplate assembly protein n=1 Tax=Brevundimonas sp. UBA7507 TaxID=1946137 RepID=UPI00257BF823|nr:MULTISPECIES: baseplate J/gp47 family protein [Brevundimonas]